MTDAHAASELELFIENDGVLYRSTTVPIFRNLATMKARGTYRHDLAVKSFGHLAEAGAKKYARDFGGVWYQLFDVPTRRAVAESLTRAFETEHSLGNYDHLLPKKYQKKETPGVGGARKTSRKTSRQLEQEIAAAVGTRRSAVH